MTDLLKNQAKIYAEHLETLRAMHKEYEKLLLTNKDKESKLEADCLMAKNMKTEAQKLRSEAKEFHEKAERHLERAKSSDEARLKVLEDIKEEEKRNQVESRQLERQKNDLDKQQDSMNRRDRFIRLDEERLKRLTERVNSMLEDTHIRQAFLEKTGA